MILRRIKTIKNLGRFVSTDASSKQFEKDTIIFANNTNGKSTFTSIFRSLQTGNSDLLVGRKTMGLTGNIKIELNFDDNGTNKIVLFDNNKWTPNLKYENICIFDTKFISESIFESENITFEQQVNLNEIIIGEEGKKLKEEINELQKQSDENSKIKRNKTTEYNRVFKFDFDKFLELPKIENIDEKIKEIEKQIKIQSEREKINNLLDNNTISKVGFSNLKIWYSKTFDLKIEEIENHINTNWKNPNYSKDFLKQGLDLMKPEQEKCVFCGQKIGNSAKELIENYSKLFQEEYRNLQQNINAEGDKFLRFDLINHIEKTNNEFKNLDLELNISIELLKDLKQAKQNFDLKIGNKQKDLNFIIDFENDTDFSFIENSINEIKERIQKIKNDKVGKIVKSLSDLEKDKTILEITKKRFQNEWITFCDEYIQLEKDSEKIRKDRDDVKRPKLDTYSLQIFKKHKDRINYFCNEMGADFKIVDFEPLKKLKGQNERIFALSFNGGKVNIDENSDNKPNFRNTLSDSDKRLLAFAFFLSHLEHDNKLDDKIIIFDDPISSFDRERKRKTINLLADVKNSEGKRPKQKIILTHEVDFFKQLLKLEEFEKAQKLKIVTKINENIKISEKGIKESHFEHCNIETDFPDDEILFKIEKVKRILDREDFNQKYSDDCRVILENIFKRKYYFDLKDEIASRKSIRTFSDKLFASNQDKRTKFIRLCNDLNIELHDNSNEFSSGDHKSILIEFFDCLKHI